MSILNKLLASAQGAAARGGTSARTTTRPARGAGTGRRTSVSRATPTSRGNSLRGIGMAKRPAPRRTAFGRQQPTTAASGLSGLIGGLLRRR
jgi:hypothetical protein